MSDRHAHPSAYDRRHSPALLPALLFSVAAHAVAGGLLFHGWQRAPVEPPQPLTVTLAPPPPPAVEMTPPPEHRHVHAPKPSSPVPARPVHVAPVPAAVVAERIEAVPAPVVPVPEIPAAPAVVATAPAGAAAAGRADAVEPPHFNVAYLNNPRPPYPAMARKLGLEGLVVLRVQVSAGGAPEKVIVAQTSGAQLLDDAALRAVQGWTFVPARRGDTPIAHAVDVPVRFHLKN